MSCDVCGQPAGGVLRAEQVLRRVEAGLWLVCQRCGACFLERILLSRGVGRKEGAR